MLMVGFWSTWCHSYSAFSLSTLGDPGAVSSSESVGRGHTGLAYQENAATVFHNPAALSQKPGGNAVLSLEWVPYIERRRRANGKGISRGNQISGLGPTAVSWSWGAERGGLMVGWLPRWNLDYTFEEESKRDRGTGREEDGKDRLKSGGNLGEFVFGGSLAFGKLGRVGGSFHHLSGSRNLSTREVSFTDLGNEPIRSREINQEHRARFFRAGAVVNLPHQITLGWIYEPAYTIHVSSRTRREEAGGETLSSESLTLNVPFRMGLGFSRAWKTEWEPRVWFEVFWQDWSRSRWRNESQGNSGSSNPRWKPGVEFRAGGEAVFGKLIFRGGVRKIPGISHQDTGMTTLTIGSGIFWKGVQINVAGEWGRRDTSQFMFFPEGSRKLEQVEETFRRVHFGLSVDFGR